MIKRVIKPIGEGKTIRTVAFADTLTGRSYVTFYCGTHKTSTGTNYIMNTNRFYSRDTSTAAVTT